MGSDMDSHYWTCTTLQEVGSNLWEQRIPAAKHQAASALQKEPD